MEQRLADRWRKGLVEGRVYWVKVKQPDGKLEPIKAVFLGMHPVKSRGEMTEWPRWRMADGTGEEFIAAGALRESDIALGCARASDSFVIATRETYKEEVQDIRASLGL